MSRRGGRQQRREGSGALPGSGGYSFTPLDIPGIAAWYRADQGVTSSGGAVSQWNDLSQTGDTNKNATASGAAKPTLNTSDAAYNGQATFSLNGSQYMTTSNWTTPLSQPATWFVVGEIDNSTAYILDGTGSTKRNAILLNGGIGEMYGGAGYTYNVNSPGLPHAWGAIFNGASSTAYQDNNNPLNTAGNAGADGILALTIGASYLTTTGTIGKVAEVIGYNVVLTPPQIAQVMAYLTARYGV